MAAEAGWAGTGAGTGAGVGKGAGAGTGGTSTPCSLMTTLVSLCRGWGGGLGIFTCSPEESNGWEKHIKYRIKLIVAQNLLSWTNSRIWPNFCLIGRLLTGTSGQEYLDYFPHLWLGQHAGQISPVLPGSLGEDQASFFLLSPTYLIEQGFSQVLRMQSKHYYHLDLMASGLLWLNSISLQPAVRFKKTDRTTKRRVHINFQSKLFCMFSAVNQFGWFIGLLTFNKPTDFSKWYRQN